jgi:glycosyltransferase involved in cell wall biosynthesis
VVESLGEYDLACYLVNDGSNDRTTQVLETINERHDWVTLLSLTENQGKGAALIEGFRRALKDGYTHALQVDADGQHDTDDIPRFLETASSNPGTLVIGDPEFDDTIPNSRLYGRQISRVWVWIETLSFEINDPLVGYRCYPLERTLELVERFQPGRRMEFDPEILVYFYWTFGEVINVPTAVGYRENAPSHFNVFTDNLRISYMHMNLFLGMLKRLPHLMSRS